MKIKQNKKLELIGVEKEIEKITKDIFILKMLLFFVVITILIISSFNYSASLRHQKIWENQIKYDENILTILTLYNQHTAEFQTLLQEYYDEINNRTNG